MTLNDFITRIRGGARISADEQEIRRLSDLGDRARAEGRLDEALGYYQQGVDLARRAGLQSAEEVLLGLIGQTYTTQKRYEDAQEIFSDALRLAERSGEGYRRARALLNMGAFRLLRGTHNDDHDELSAARADLEKALELARASNDSTTIGLALGNLADVYLKQDNAGYALRLLKEAAPLIMQNTGQAAYLMGRMGQAHLALGESDRARKTLAQAVRLAEQNNQPDQELLWANALADLMFKEGQLSEAIRLYERAGELSARNTQNPQAGGELRSVINQAVAYQRLGESQKALDLSQTVLDRLQTLPNPDIEALARSTMGSAQQALGQPDAAIQSLKAAIDLYDTQVKNIPERSQAIITLGNLYLDREQYEEALATFEEVLKNTADYDRIARAHALRRIGNVYQKRGDYANALDRWSMALDLFEEAGERGQAARLLCDIGSVKRIQGGLRAALPDFERATVLLNAVKDSNTRGLVLSNVANLYTDMGEVETAQSFYQESIHIARQLGNRRAESVRLGNFGWFYIMTGKPQEGARLVDEALTISRQLNDPLLIAVQTNNAAQAQHELRNYSLAESMYRDALMLAEAQPNLEPRWSAMIRSNLARTLLATNRTDEALNLLESSLSTSRAANDQETVTRTQARLAEAYLRKGEIDKADTAAREAETVAQRWGYRKGQADALYVRAGVARAREQSPTHFLQEARKLYDILHDPMVSTIDRELGV
jgi:tetratricopeptide (TPR) repeat protein